MGGGGGPSECTRTGRGLPSPSLPLKARRVLEIRVFCLRTVFFELIDYSYILKEKFKKRNVTFYVYLFMAQDIPLFFVFQNIHIA